MDGEVRNGLLPLPAVVSLLLEEIIPVGQRGAIPGFWCLKVSSVHLRPALYPGDGPQAVAGPFWRNEGHSQTCVSAGSAMGVSVVWI